MPHASAPFQIHFVFKKVIMNNTNPNAGDTISGAAEQEAVTHTDHNRRYSD